MPAWAPGGSLSRQCHVLDCSTKATDFHEEAEGWLWQPHSSTHLGIWRLSVEVSMRTDWLGEWFLKPKLLYLNLEMHNTTPTAARGSYLHWYLGCSPRRVQCLRESWCAMWSCVLLLPGQILPHCWNSQTRFNCEGMIIAERRNDCKLLCRHVRTPGTWNHSFAGRQTFRRCKQDSWFDTKVLFLRAELTNALSYT